MPAPPGPRNEPLFRGGDRLSSPMRPTDGPSRVAFKDDTRQEAPFQVPRIPGWGREGWRHAVAIPHSSRQGGFLCLGDSHPRPLKWYAAVSRRKGLLPRCVYLSLPVSGVPSTQVERDCAQDCAYDDPKRHLLTHAGPTWQNPMRAWKCQQLRVFGTRRHEDSGSKGHRFKSCQAYQASPPHRNRDREPLAQLAEQLTLNQ